MRLPDGLRCVGVWSVSADLDQKAVGAGAVGSSTLAVVACAACCALPLAIPALALGTSGAILAWLAGAHEWIRGVAGVAMLSGWGWAIHVRRQGGPLRRATWIMLGVSTVLTVIAFLWTAIEHGLGVG